MSELPTTIIKVNLTPNQSIYKWARETPDFIAITSGSLELSYIQTANYIAKFIKVFENLGVQKGMLVALNFKDGTHHRVLELMMVFSLEAIGAIRVSNLSDDDIAERCQFIFTDGTLESLASYQINALVCVITDEWISAAMNTIISSKDLERLDYQPSPEELVLMGNTSGTTGKKKHFAWQASVKADALAFMSEAYFPNSIQDCLMMYSAHFVAACAGASITFMKGGTVVFTSLENFLQDTQSNPKSYSVLLLNDINYLMKYFPEGLGDQKLAFLLVIGSYLPPNIRIWLETYLAEQVINSYASNESGHIAETLPNGHCQIYPQVKIRILDQHWNDLPQGGIGYISIQSPWQISGYLWNSELNALHFKDDWFRSNDIGYLAPEGNLILVDRADNMLNLAGIKVAPAPIEAQIKLLPGVDDCVLLEEDNLSDLQTIAICIETSQATDRASLEKAVIAILAKRLKSYHFHYLPSFPRTETGKVKRKVLQIEILKAIS